MAFFTNSEAQESMIRSGFHRFELMKSTWEVPTRYINLNYIGSGAYGLVCSAYDQKTCTDVAIKKLCNPFYCEIAGKRTFREVMLLKFMDHDNVINLSDIFTHSLTLDAFDTIYIVMPLMKLDLRVMITDHREHLTEKNIRCIVYQILKGVRYIHSTGIIHRDLKPGNIAVNEDLDLKILDFGLARNVDEAQGMTGYVFTRWYRAPEIILNWRKYTKTADIWSVGCIMAELFTGKVLFKGSDKLDQIRKIIDILGKPSDDFCQELPVASQDYIRKSFSSSSPSRALRKMLKKSGAPKDAISLIEQMLEMDPNKRLTASAALIHPYFNQCECLFSPSVKPDLSSQAYDSGHDEHESTIQGWKALVFGEVVNFDPEILTQSRVRRQETPPPLHK